MLTYVVSIIVKNWGKGDGGLGHPEKKMDFFFQKLEKKYLYKRFANMNLLKIKLYTEIDL